MFWRSKIGVKSIFLENNLVFGFSTPKNHTIDKHMSMIFILIFLTSRGHLWMPLMEVKNIKDSLGSNVLLFEYLL